MTLELFFFFFFFWRFICCFAHSRPGIEAGAVASNESLTVSGVGLYQKTINHETYILYRNFELIWVMLFLVIRNQVDDSAGPGHDFQFKLFWPCAHTSLQELNQVTKYSIPTRPQPCNLPRPPVRLHQCRSPIVKKLTRALKHVPKLSSRHLMRFTVFLRTFWKLK